MEDVFRFLLVRPPEEPDEPKGIRVEIAGEFLKALVGAKGEADPRSVILGLGQGYLESDRFVSRLADLRHGPALERMVADFRSQIPEEPTEYVRKVFGVDVSELVDDSAFAEDRGRLFESLVAAKMTGHKMVSALAEGIQVFRWLEELELCSGWTNCPGGFFERSIVLPEGIFPLPRGLVRSSGGEDVPVQTGGSKSAEALSRLEKALGALMNLRAADFTTSPPVIAPSGSGDGGLNVITVKPGGVPFTISGEAFESIPESARLLLVSLDLDPRKLGLGKVLRRLDDERKKLSRRLVGGYAPAVHEVVQIGDKFVDTNLSGFLSWMGRLGSPEDVVPHSKGSVQPAGFANLLVVKQQLSRYERGEVAHVENVMQSEQRLKEHRRALSTTDTQITETESVTEEERDLQTTERFELKREVENVVKQDSELRAGASLSISYGEFVEFKSNVNASSKNIREESAKQSADFAREVTKRAASRISERVRVIRSRTTVSELEERNEHGFDNTVGDGHVVGVYQWVDKIYEAQVFNYDKRMLFDLVVPEPAAFWIYSRAHPETEEEALEKPDVFSIAPDELDDTNYMSYVRQYAAKGIEPPPAEFVTVAKTFTGTSAEKKDVMTAVAELEVPDGYQVSWAWASCSFTYWEDKEKDPAITVIVGKGRWDFGKSSVQGGFDTDLQTEFIPVAVTTFRIQGYTVAIEVLCQRTERAYEVWQLKTHEAMMTAYQGKVQEYEKKLAERNVDQEMELDVEGRNSVENRRIEREEIKKGCISILTDQHFDLFNATEESGEGYPQVDLQQVEAEGRYIRFFEQAFEWEQMMYLFYPYFWSDKPHWRNRVQLDDQDAQFGAFLRAGAARAVVPVRRDFEQAVAHFMDTGEVWNGGDLPKVSSPLYVNIIDEIKERQGAGGGERPEGEPWEVRVPTSLVILRDDGQLPEWTKQEDGSWVPKN